MKSMKYSIRQSVVTVATLCLITEFGFAQANCQNGYDYKNSCNPYKVKFIKVQTTSKSSKSQNIATKNYLHKRHHRTRGYLDTLIDRYSSSYNGEYGLQAVIDRSAYKTLNLKKIDNSLSGKSSTSKSTKTSKKVAKSKEKEVFKKDVTSKVENIAKKEVSNNKRAIEITKVDTTKKKVAKVIKNDVKKIEKVKPSKVKVAKSSYRVKKDIKNKSKAVEKKIAKLKNSKTEVRYKLYTVKKGDSLSKIAKRFNISTKELRAINSFDKDSTVKIGLKIKLPNSVKLKRVEKIASKKKHIKTNRDYYVVRRGDTLSKIAKNSNISITKLREINRLSRSSSIKVGEKIYLKPTKLTKRRDRSFSFVKNIKFKKIPFSKHKRKIRVVATAYTSHTDQTDNTPFLAAWNNRIRPGMKIIAVSPDLIRKYGLTNGVKVKIMGLPGFYTVRDKMNKRLRNHIDIYMGVNKRRALRWGRRRIVLYW